MSDKTMSLIGLDTQGNRHWIGDFSAQDIVRAAHAWLQQQYGECRLEDMENNSGSQFKHPNSPHGYMTMDAFTCSPEMRGESMKGEAVIGPSPMWSGIR